MSLLTETQRAALMDTLRKEHESAIGKVEKLRIHHLEKLMDATKANVAEFHRNVAISLRTEIANRNRWFKEMQDIITRGTHGN